MFVLADFKTRRQEGRLEIYYILFDFLYFHIKIMFLSCSGYHKYHVAYSTPLL
jgi:hypothetical protein